MPKHRAPTLKQERFVLAYLGEAKGNASKAAETAGYKGDFRAIGHENLTKPYIRARIDGRLDASGATVDAVHMELTEVAFSAASYRSSGEILDPPAVQAKVKAPELLGRYHAMFTDVVKGVDIPKDEKGLEAFIRREFERVYGREPESVH